MSDSRKPARVLGIETSCDETGLCLLQMPAAPGGMPTILGEALHSQVALHAEYGGVVPELASRDHLRRLLPLLEQVLTNAQCGTEDIDAIAFTQGPGLAGALWTGAMLASGLAMGLGRPLIPVHHLEAHLMAPLMEPRKDPRGTPWPTGTPGAATASTTPFPLLALLVSGGHTQLLSVEGLGQIRLLGETIDDAAGEAFDKSAQVLGLGYPGGPALAACAADGRPGRFKLPRPLLNRPGCDFSFAGLKTAVALAAQRLPGHPSPSAQDRADLAAEAQAAIVKVLLAKTLTALELSGHRRLLVSGGVSANALLRAGLESMCEARGVELLLPAPRLCTDNGVMVAWAGGLRLQAGEAPLPPTSSLGVRPRWPLEELQPPSDSLLEARPHVGDVAAVAPDQQKR